MTNSYIQPKADIFAQLFGTSDPFAAEGKSPEGGFQGFGGGDMPGMQSMGGAINGGFGGMGGGQMRPPKQSKPKGKSVTHELNVSLLDLFKGTTKKVRITASKNGRKQTSDKTIDIKAGWKDGTKITYSNEGDEDSNHSAGDIIFMVKSKPHEYFTRDGDDLIYTCNTTLHEALSGIRTDVTHLDGRRIPLVVRSATPETVINFSGEGFVNNKTKTRGCMKVKFLIKFPELNDEQKQKICAILSSGNPYK